jgi:hypothetical protein
MEIIEQLTFPPAQAPAQGSASEDLLRAQVDELNRQLADIADIKGFETADELGLKLPVISFLLFVCGRWKFAKRAAERDIDKRLKSIHQADTKSALQLLHGTFDARCTALIQLSQQSHPLDGIQYLRHMFDVEFAGKAANTGKAANSSLFGEVISPLLVCIAHKIPPQSDRARAVVTYNASELAGAFVRHVRSLAELPGTSISASLSQMEQFFVARMGDDSPLSLIGFVAQQQELCESAMLELFKRIVKGNLELLKSQEQEDFANHDSDLEGLVRLAIEDELLQQDLTCSSPLATLAKAEQRINEQCSFQVFEDAGQGSFLAFASKLNLETFQLQGAVGNFTPAKIASQDVQDFLRRLPPDICSGEYCFPRIYEVARCHFGPDVCIDQLQRLLMVNTMESTKQPPQSQIPVAIHLALTDSWWEIGEGKRHSIQCALEQVDGNKGMPEIAAALLESTPILANIADHSQWGLFQDSLGDIMKFITDTSTPLSALEISNGIYIRLPELAGNLVEHFENRNPVAAAATILKSVVDAGNAKDAPIEFLSRQVIEGLQGFASIQEQLLFILRACSRIPQCMRRTCAYNILVQPVIQKMGASVLQRFLDACENTEQERILHSFGLEFRHTPWAAAFSESLSSKTPEPPHSPPPPPPPHSPSYCGPDVLHRDQEFESVIAPAGSAGLDVDPVSSTAGILELGNVKPESAEHDSQNEELLGEIRRAHFPNAHDFENMDPVVAQQLQSQMQESRNLASRAIQRLAADLYSQDIHFVLEIVQNADDNQYEEGSVPMLKVCLNSTNMTFFMNEKGFLPKNVRALCDIGQSTKSRDSTGYIGNKGIGQLLLCSTTHSTFSHASLLPAPYFLWLIGFKSVFKVTTTPAIHSNQWHFKFDSNDENLGYIMPQPIPKPDGWVSGDGTLLVLPLVLRGNGQTNSAVSEDSLLSLEELQLRLSEIRPSTLLFLNRLRKICIVDELTGVEQLMTRTNSEHADDEVKIAHSHPSGDRDEHYFVVNKQLEVPTSTQRPGVLKTTLSLAFPIPTRLVTVLHNPDDPDIEDPSEDPRQVWQDRKIVLPVQDVFAFLPLSSYGLRFVVQADWMVSSSRESIIASNSWNQWLRTEIPSLFVEAAARLIARASGFGTVVANGERKLVAAAAHLLSLLFAFVPLPHEVSDFFRCSSRGILRALKKTECIPVAKLGKTDGVVFVLPRSAVLRPASPQATPFLAACIECFESMNLAFVDKGLFVREEIGQELGIKSLDGPLLVDVLRHKAAEWRIVEDVDHAWVAWVLGCICDDPSCGDQVKLLREIKFVPMNDGALRPLSPATIGYELSMDQDFLSSFADEPSIISPAFLECCKRRDGAMQVLRMMGMQKSDGKSFIFENMLPVLKTTTDVDKMVKILQFCKLASAKFADIETVIADIVSTVCQGSMRIAMHGGGFGEAPLRDCHLWTAHSIDSSFLPDGWDSSNWPRVSRQYSTIDNDEAGWTALMYKLGVQPLFSVQNIEQVFTVKIYKLAGVVRIQIVDEGHSELADVILEGDESGANVIVADQLLVVSSHVTLRAPVCDALVHHARAWYAEHQSTVAGDQEDEQADLELLTARVSVQDFVSEELEKLIRELASQKAEVRGQHRNHAKLCIFGRALCEHFEAHYLSTAQTHIQWAVGQLPPANMHSQVPSSWMQFLRENAWLPDSQGRLATPAHLFLNDEKITRIVGAIAPVAATSALSGKAVPDQLGLKSCVTAESVTNALVAYAENFSTRPGQKARLNELAVVYKFLAFEKSRGRMNEATVDLLAKAPVMFVPHHEPWLKQWLGQTKKTEFVRTGEAVVSLPLGGEFRTLASCVVLDKSVVIDGVNIQSNARWDGVIITPPAIKFGECSGVRVLFRFYRDIDPFETLGVARFPSIEHYTRMLYKAAEEVPPCAGKHHHSALLVALRVLSPLSTLVCPARGEPDGDVQVTAPLGNQEEALALALTGNACLPTLAGTFTGIDELSFYTTRPASDVHCAPNSRCVLPKEVLQMTAVVRHCDKNTKKRVDQKYMAGEDPFKRLPLMYETLGLRSIEPSNNGQLEQPWHQVYQTEGPVTQLSEQQFLFPVVALSRLLQWWVQMHRQTAAVQTMPPVFAAVPSALASLEVKLATKVVSEVQLVTARGDVVFSSTQGTQGDFSTEAPVAVVFSRKPAFALPDGGQWQWCILIRNSSHHDNISGPELCRMMSAFEFCAQVETLLGDEDGLAQFLTDRLGDVAQRAENDATCVQSANACADLVDELVRTAGVGARCDSDGQVFGKVTLEAAEKQWHTSCSGDFVGDGLSGSVVFAGQEQSDESSTISSISARRIATLAASQAHKQKQQELKDKRQQDGPSAVVLPIVCSGPHHNPLMGSNVGSGDGGSSHSSGDGAAGEPRGVNDATHGSERLGGDGGLVVVVASDDSSVAQVPAKEHTVERQAVMVEAGDADFAATVGIRAEEYSYRHLSLMCGSGFSRKNWISGNSLRSKLDNSENGDVRHVDDSRGCDFHFISNGTFRASQGSAVVDAGIEVFVEAKGLAGVFNGSFALSANEKLTRDRVCARGDKYYIFIVDRCGTTNPGSSTSTLNVVDWSSGHDTELKLQPSAYIATVNCSGVGALPSNQHIVVPAPAVAVITMPAPAPPEATLAPEVAPALSAPAPAAPTTPQQQLRAELRALLRGSTGILGANLGSVYEMKYGVALKKQYQELGFKKLIDVMGSMQGVTSAPHGGDKKFSLQGGEKAKEPKGDATTETVLTTKSASVSGMEPTGRPSTADERKCVWLAMKKHIVEKHNGRLDMVSMKPFYSIMPHAKAVLCTNKQKTLKTAVNTEGVHYGLAVEEVPPRTFITVACDHEQSLLSDSTPGYSASQLEVQDRKEWSQDQLYALGLTDQHPEVGSLEVQEGELGYVALKKQCALEGATAPAAPAAPAATLATAAPGVKEVLAALLSRISASATKSCAFGQLGGDVGNDPKLRPIVVACGGIRSFVETHPEHFQIIQDRVHAAADSRKLDSGNPRGCKRQQSHPRGRAL